MPTQAAQRDMALELANEVRTRRAEAKQQIKEDRTVLARFVLDPPDWMETARVFDFVRVVPRVSDHGAQMIFRRAKVLTHRRFGDLTDRERIALAGQL